MKTSLQQSAVLKQELRMNPRLYQAMDLLHMPLLDLLQHLKTELEVNPFLELDEGEDLDAGESAEEQGQEEGTGDEGGDETDWEEFLLDGFSADRGRMPAEQVEVREPIAVETPDLADHLWDQLFLLELDERQLFLCEELIGNIDDDGYLRASLDEIREMGDYETALAHCRQLRSSPLFHFIWRAPVAHQRVRMAHALLTLGQHAEAEALLAESAEICEKMIETGDERYGFPEVLAMVHSIRGNTEEALHYLREAIEAGWRWEDVALKDPIWNGLHDEPRFLQLIAEVKSDVDRMRSQVAELEESWTRESRSPQSTAGF